MFVVSSFYWWCDWTLVWTNNECFRPTISTFVDLIISWKFIGFLALKWNRLYHMHPSAFRFLNSSSFPLYTWSLRWFIKFAYSIVYHLLTLWAIFVNVFILLILLSFYLNISGFAFIILCYCHKRFSIQFLCGSWSLWSILPSAKFTFWFHSSFLWKGDCFSSALLTSRIKHNSCSDKNRSYCHIVSASYH